MDSGGPRFVIHLPAASVVALEQAWQVLVHFSRNTMNALEPMRHQQSTQSLVSLDHFREYISSIVLVMHFRRQNTRIAPAVEIF